MRIECKHMNVVIIHPAKLIKNDWDSLADKEIVDKIKTKNFV